MKKIVFFISSINESGGTERVSSLIANKLSERGYKVHFLSLYNGGKSFFKVNDEIEKDTLFDEKICFKRKYHKVLIKLREYIKENDVDVLVNVDSILVLYSLPACFGLKVRNICWEHFNFLNNSGLKLRTISRYIAAFLCNDIVTLTEQDKRLWLQKTFNRAKITTIYNPTSFELSKPRSKIKSKVILTAGRLTRVKGFDLLLEAWALVIEQRKDWTLRIVGSGEEYDSLKSQAEILGIIPSIQWISHVSNMAEQYEDADLYVMSSRFEGLPMVLLEAISTGLPLVSFDCKTGPREIIDTSCGWLVDDGNIVMLADKILEAFRVFDNDLYYYQFSQSAIKKCRDEFYIDPIINKWVKLIENEK